MSVVLSRRKMQSGGSEEGNLKWIESGDRGDKWQMAQVPIQHEDAFWVTIGLWWFLSEIIQSGGHK